MLRRKSGDRELDELQLVVEDSFQANEIELPGRVLLQVGLCLLNRCFIRNIKSYFLSQASHLRIVGPTRERQYPSGRYP